MLILYLQEDGILATDIKVPACLPGNSIITISDDDDDDEVQLLSIQDSNVSRETKRVCFPKDNISPIIRTDDNDDDDDDDYDIAIIEVKPALVFYTPIYYFIFFDYYN